MGYYFHLRLLASRAKGLGQTRGKKGKYEKPSQLLHNSDSPPHFQTTAASSCRSFLRWLNRKSRHTEDIPLPVDGHPEYHLNKS